MRYLACMLGCLIGCIIYDFVLADHIYSFLVKRRCEKDEQILEFQE